MDNILVELERIDHIAEIEAATKPKLDNPIALPTKPEIEDTLSTPTEVIVENLVGEPSEVAEKSANTLYTPPEVMVENLVGEPSDVADKLFTPPEIAKHQMSQKNRQICYLTYPVIYRNCTEIIGVHLLPSGYFSARSLPSS
jgi:hypothetical protein